MLLRLILSAVFVASAFLAAACSVRTPAPVVPNPDDAGVDKSFFAELATEDVEISPAVFNDKGQKVSERKVEKRTVYKPKTFLCGWVPVNENGWVSEIILMHQVQITGHCNIEFEITENWLIGRMINPSFPNDRKRWKDILQIPIKSHYYSEKSKDGYGRDTNETIDNSGRSAWSARPKLKLELSGLRILDESMGLLFDSRTGSINKVSDTEWDFKNNFLGFTVNTTSPLFGGDHSGRFRFNFLAFKHNPNFKKTPYHPQNSKHLNALHVMGEKIDGVAPVLYAAHWDVTKQREVRLHNFPAEFIPMATEIVKDWNDVFAREVGAQAPFKVNTEPLQYGFDLRYPSMIWVDDPLISMHSPLGVGMALSDVRNGEILWGGITLYTGMLERYIKSYLPSLTQKAGKSQSPLAAFGEGLLKIADLGVGFFDFPQVRGLPPGIAPANVSNEYLRSGLKSLMSREEETRVDQELVEHLRKIGESGDFDAAKKLTKADIAALRETLRQKLSATGSNPETASREIMGRYAEKLGYNDARMKEIFQQLSFPNMIGSPKGGDVASDKIWNGKYHQMSPKERSNHLLNAVKADAKEKSESAGFGFDRTFADVAPGWAAALAAQKTPDYDKALRIIVKELMTHEYGHFLGLGHQFKENILPAPGTVPTKIYESLKAKADANMTNSTSVMGYKHPTTELFETEADAVPGPQDGLVVRYLYGAQYATFDKAADKFEYVDVPANGIIPERNPAKPQNLTSYFPQCNDFAASYSIDPFCNRFDRGYNAETIMKSYIDDLGTNLISRIYSFADVRGGNARMAEYYLWMRSLEVTGRIRIFYDYMRQKFSEDIERISGDPKNLYEFSRACADELTSNATLNDLFERKPELKELCRVNRGAIRELTNLAVNPGPDFTRMDFDNQYFASSMMGGDADYDASRMFGTRTALSVIPLKYSAINALTTTHPYFFYRGWMVGIPRFSGEQGNFAYGSLYPVEFTQAVAGSLEKNLKFGTVTGQKATMGRVALALGSFLNGLYFSNDSGRFPKEYLETIRKQSSFRASIVAVIVKMVSRDDKSRITHVEPRIYEFMTGNYTNGGEAFILPEGKLIVKGPNRSFVFPISKLFFFRDDPGNAEAYALAYRVTYEEGDDVLTAHSVKNALEKLHTSVLDACIRGNNNGLASFFNRQEDKNNFPGFEVQQGILSDKEKQQKFLDSIKVNFQAYYKAKAKTANPPRPEICEESLKGLGLIVSSALVLDGFFVPEVWDYLVK